MKILYSLITVVQPSYVFVHVNSFEDWKYYYAYYNTVPGISKLFLFSLTNHQPQIFVGSITSSEFILTQSMDTIDHVDSMWDALNKENLHGSIACGPDLQRFQEIQLRPIAEWFCVSQVLGDKHNFTYAEARNLKRTWDKVLIIGDMRFDLFLTEGAVHSLRQESYPILELDFEELQFTVVTKFPSKINSIFGVFTPFDGATWALILFSCLTMTLILQFDGNGVAPRFAFLHTMGDFCLLNSILFGQSIADEILRAISNKKVAVPILTVWFFGCYLLMDNLYQGTIYSDLTVMYPPKVPKSLEALAMSNMSVFTTTWLGFPPLDINCFITSGLIPMLRQHSNISGWLDDLQKRIIFIHPNIVDASLAEKMSNSKPVVTHFNESFSTTDTFAILDRPSELGLLTASLQMLGKRLVVENKLGNILNFNTFVEGRRNFFIPIFHQGLYKLRQSGIFSRWEILRGMKEKLRFMRQYEESVYKRYLVKLNSNFQEPSIFHESGDGDAVGALFYVIGLCAVLVGVGVVALGWECRDELELLFKVIGRIGHDAVHKFGQ
ncbi:hypothetical protein Fcan01_16000 [Folsomia candida]|uniref:Uncharacterized protein n=1 Tax=Folsomia candida TaxID=158441 RepID=A0A226DYP4_FOLCA|nr:hypothetical protein Fcan01_16000 [Folsomia candida]